MSGHEVYTASSRYGAYAHCACGWSSEGYRTRLGASLGWAKHLAEKASRRARTTSDRSIQ